MINGTEWLVVTKMDVMDECAEIPVCTGYKINGKLTDVIPADMRGFESIQPVYTTLKGWNASTEGITEFDKLPKLAQDYLRFLERESGAKIGMVSTGPDRDQTMTLAGVRRSAEGVSDERTGDYAEFYRADEVRTAGPRAGGRDAAPADCCVAAGARMRELYSPTSSRASLHGADLRAVCGRGGAGASSQLRRTFISMRSAGCTRRCATGR